MNDYKFTNKAGTAVKSINNSSSCVEGGDGWQEYLDYVHHGGKTDPWKTPEELFETALSEKLLELKDERDRRADAAVGTSDSRKKTKMVSRAIKLLRRETKGQSTPQDEAELDALEAMDDYLDSMNSEHDTAEAWLEDAARTIEEIDVYDVVSDPAWTVYTV